jgi:uncharacterized protein (TIGR00369 family)
MTDLPMPTDLPEGFRPLPMGGEFMRVNGPLYLRHDGDDGVQVGFRVEKRHTNPMDICHGGMMASFCDMLLPISIHRKSKVGQRFLPTINLQIDFLAPAPLGAWVQGEGQVLRVTRAMVFAQGLVSADGVPAVRVSGIFKIGHEFGAAGPATR